ncbi:MAG: DUF5074 domain-containing protein [Marinifilaceae bacterium]
MKKINLLIVLFVVTLGLFSSCEKDNNDNNLEPEISLDGNAIILNEGASAKGSISMFNEENGTINNGYYEKMNGKKIAASTQSISLHNGKLYCLTYGADGMVIMDATDNMKVNVNPLTTGLITPRFFTAKGNRGYVSCYGKNYYPNYEESFIAVIDLDSNEIISTIKRKGGFEDLAIVGDKLYAASINTKEVAVFDINKNVFLKAISIPDNGRFLIKNSDNNLWVSHSSYIGNDNKGISLINTQNDTVEKTIKTPRMASSGIMASNTDASKIFVLGAEGYPSKKSSIILVETSNNKVVAKALIEGESFYGLGYNQKTERIYVLRSPDYATPGFISVYKSDGTAVYENITSGVSPKQVLFF